MLSRLDHDTMSYDVSKGLIKRASRLGLALVVVCILLSIFMIPAGIWMVLGEPTLGIKKGRACLITNESFEMLKTSTSLHLVEDKECTADSRVLAFEHPNRPPTYFA